MPALPLVRLVPRNGNAQPSLLADIANLLLQHQAVELDEREADQKLDPTLENVGHTSELAKLLFVSTFKQRWIFHAPVSGDWLSGPTRQAFDGVGY